MSLIIELFAIVVLFFVLRQQLLTKDALFQSISKGKLSVLVLFPLVFAIFSIGAAINSFGSGDMALNAMTGYRSWMSGTDPNWDNAVWKSALGNLGEEGQAYWAFTDMYESLSVFAVVVLLVCSIAIIYKYFHREAYKGLSFKLLGIVSAIVAIGTYAFYTFTTIVGLPAVKMLVERQGIEVADENMESFRTSLIVICFLVVAFIIAFTMFYCKAAKLIKPISANPSKLHFQSASNNNVATKVCRYCGETIMATAKKCRYCGEWLDKTDAPTPDSTIPTETSTTTDMVQPTEPNAPKVQFVEPEKPKKNNTKWIVIGAIAAAVIIALVVIAIPKSRTNEDPVDISTAPAVDSTSYDTTDDGVEISTVPPVDSVTETNIDEATSYGSVAQIEDVFDKSAWINSDDNIGFIIKNGGTIEVVGANGYDFDVLARFTYSLSDDGGTAAVRITELVNYTNISHADALSLFENPKFYISYDGEYLSVSYAGTLNGTYHRAD